MGKLMERGLQLALELGDRLAHALLLRFRKALEVLRVDDHAIASRGETETERRSDERDAGRLGMLLDLRQPGLATRLDLRLDRLFAAAVALAFEGGRDGSLQLDAELGHRFAQAGPGAGRQAQGLRSLRVREVVDVAPVIRRRHAGGAASQELADSCGLADPGRSEGEHVEAARGRRDRQVDRLDSPVLADDLVHVRDVRGGGEPQVRRRAVSVQVFHLERPGAVEVAGCAGRRRRCVGLVGKRNGHRLVPGAIGLRLSPDGELAHRPFDAVTSAERPERPGLRERVAAGRDRPNRVPA